MYSAYDGEDECEPTSNRKVLILGGGPNRIGQGIEFDYCCCHASFSLRDAGYETIMMNSNPETVSTDYDTSSRLYFEPLTVGGWVGGWACPLRLVTWLSSMDTNVLDILPSVYPEASPREDRQPGVWHALARRSAMLWGWNASGPSLRGHSAALQLACLRCLPKGLVCLGGATAGHPLVAQALLALTPSPFSLSPIPHPCTGACLWLHPSTNHSLPAGRRWRMS